MKITIDTTDKTVIVYGEATFKEIESFLRIIAPESWNSYRLTCQNVPIQSFGGSTVIGAPNLYVGSGGYGGLTYTNDGHTLTTNG